MSSETLAIEVRTRDGTSSKVTVGGQNVVIGRARDAQVPLESNTISRRHAEMVRDPFGRWWIRDLGSRNGTHVNGIRITESVIKPGDQIDIGEFSLAISAADDTHAAAPPPPTDEASHHVPVVDGHAGKITTLKDFETPRLSATHLSTLSEFGQNLLSLEDPAQRILALCKLMVRPDFHGRSAVVLRASKESLTEPPTLLCKPESAADYKDWSPYLSRTVLRTVLARNDAVLAANKGSMGGGGAPAGVDAAEMSITSDVMAISAVAVPIKSEKTYTDMLYVILPPEFGTSEWLALAALAVKQFQQAEANWAGKKLGEAHAAIERELGQAHAIQERLVPRNIQIAGLDFAVGFTPCKWVGGDYVDVVTNKNGKVLLTVADVCGKGLPAALVASSLHMMTHTAMRANTPLTAIMQNLNVYLAESLTAGTFVTMIAALLDPATGKLETINAGHPPGLFVAKTGAVEFTQSEANMPLGLDPDAELLAETTTLETGTFLFLYSDGLTELPVAEGQLLGEDKLALHIDTLAKSKSASAAGIATELTRLLDSLQEGMAQDDRTFLLARRM